MDTLKIAREFNIKITRAAQGTEMYECWEDRVQRVAFLSGKKADKKVIQEAIEDANAYAI